MKRIFPSVRTLAASGIRRRPALFALVTAALLAWSACNLSDPADTHRFIELKLPDSLLVGDSVEAILSLPGGMVVVDTLWNGPLSADTSLAKLPAPHYRGGDVDLFVAAWHQDRLFYRSQVGYRKGEGSPTVLNILPPDSLPPVLKWQGPDSMDVEVLPGEAGFSALFPEMSCLDDRDRDPAKPAVQIIADSLRPGLCWFEYHCRDRSGNASRPRYRRVRILSQVDTVPPVIFMQPDTLVTRPGVPIPPAMVSCTDTQDPSPVLRSSGSIDRIIPGLDSLLYECTDASGNVGRRAWYVRLEREPDTVKPVLVVRGPDSLTVFDGLTYADQGADCNDDRDGKLPVMTQNHVDTHWRSDYVVSYTCVDSAGNSAWARRQVRVVRKPDLDKPVIALRGPDTALVYDHEVYRDSGATCVDARDGALPVKTAGSIDTDQRGLQTLTFSCADSSENAASVVRQVLVARRSDLDKPVIVLRGPDTALVYDHQLYRDSGAVCLDVRDGMLPVKTVGAIDTEQRGLQTLTFNCADSAGNAASVKRVVRVARLPDAVNPVLTLKGPDSLQVWQGSDYADSGAVCLDARDGSLPIRIAGSVNTAVRGSYSLTLQCADSSGNSASQVRKVAVIRVPDMIKPALSLRGPDSLQVWQGAAFADSGADCLDDRDGRLPVQTAGAINTALRGLQTLAFHCADSAGNQAAAIRKVLVIRVPDTVKPEITLRGNASVTIALGHAYADPGADCLDDRDGALPVATRASVNTAAEGTYVLSYACTDSAGNAAATVTRSVTVAAGDTTPPVISLAGADTMVVVSQAGFVDPGGSCRDSVDGVLPLTLQGITKPVTAPSWYQASYTCTDKSGNTAVKLRTLKVGLFGAYLADTADGELDTVNTWANLGGTAGSNFVKEPGGQYFGIVRFDLSKVNRTGLKSAKLHYFTFLYGQTIAPGFHEISFQVYRVKSDWVEGTGDWFYHDGGYRNGGEICYQYYPLSDSMKAHVTNPSVASGTTGASGAIIRQSAMALVSSQSDSLYFPSYPNPTQYPAPDRLTPIELDVTDYVESADPAADYGFVVKVFGVPAGSGYGFLNREAGGGPWAPRLMLEY